MSDIFVSPFARATLSNGLIAAGAKLFFYISGTTTPAVVYADDERTVPLTNPVPADASGRFPLIVLDPDTIYRVRLTSAIGTLLAPDADPVYGQTPGLAQVEVNTAAIAAEVARAMASEDTLDVRITNTNTDVDQLQGTITSGRRAYAIYAAAVTDAATPAIYPAVTAGTLAEVPLTDTGTHTDPVVGGTVDNSGIFRWSVSPAGWQRLYATDAASAIPYRDQAQAQAQLAAEAADTVINTNLTLGINPDSRITTRLGDDSGSTYNANGPGYLFFASEPTPAYGRITSLRASFGGSAGNGTALVAYIVVISPDENGAFKVSTRIDLKQYYEGLHDYPVEIYAPAGSYVTIRSFFWPVNLRSTGGPGGFYAATTGADAGVGSPVSLTFGAETISISYELETVPNSLDERLRGISDRLAVLPEKARFSPHQITLVRQPFATLPATGTGTGDHWTYAGGTWTASNGLIASTPGWGTYAVWNAGYSSIARRLFQTEITSPSSADIGGICTVPLEGYSGGVAVVDRPAGKLRLYAWTGSGTGTLMREAALPAGTGARRYRIIVDRDDLEITVTCADLETGDTASVTGYNLIPAAAFHGRMGVIALAGAPEFEAFRVTAPYRSDPLAVIVGDSITDGWNVYTPPNLSWASKLAFGRDDIIVAGRSGDETGNFLLRSQLDLLSRTPKLGILALGTNDYDQAEWRINIAALIGSMQGLNIEPVLVTVPPRGGETIRQAMNADIRGGYFGRLRYIDMSRALTLNHDGVNWNSAMDSGDHIHPSDAGAEAMRQRALIDIPELA